MFRSLARLRKLIWRRFVTYSARSEEPMMPESSPMTCFRRFVRFGWVKVEFISISCFCQVLIYFENGEEHIETAAVREYFDSLGLDVSDAWSFFKLLDSDGGAKGKSKTIVSLISLYDFGFFWYLANMDSIWKKKAQWKFINSTDVPVYISV